MYSQRDNGFRAKFERYIATDRDNADRRRKAISAVTAKMARVVHAVIKTGTDYRPFVEAGGAKWKDPSPQSRQGAPATL